MKEIPPITDPLGRGWSQPDVGEIIVDETHAVMSERAFNRLKQYDCSLPSGVYEGKMWKKKSDSDFFLAWFEDANRKNAYGNDVMNINWRKILILES